MVTFHKIQSKSPSWTRGTLKSTKTFLLNSVFGIRYLLTFQITIKPKSNLLVGPVYIFPNFDADIIIPHNSVRGNQLQDLKAYVFITETWLYCTCPPIFQSFHRISGKDNHAVRWEDAKMSKVAFNDKNNIQKCKTSVMSPLRSGIFYSMSIFEHLQNVKISYRNMIHLVITTWLQQTAFVIIRI